MENNEYLDATAAYEMAVKSKKERQEKRKKEVWEAIKNQAAAGEFYLLEEYLSEDLIRELRKKGFEVNYSKGMFLQEGYYKIE